MACSALAANLAPRSARLASRAFSAGRPVQVRPALPRRRAPAQLNVFARAASKQQQKAAYICVDCGYIYDGLEGPFEKLSSSYRCPVCNAPKRRFKPYAGAAGRNDSKSMNARWQKLQSGGGLAEGGSGSGDNSALLIGLVAGAVALAGVYFYLSSVYN